MFFELRWKRIGKTREAAAFLRAREKRCVAASSRFLHMNRSEDLLWKWPAYAAEIKALIFYNHHILFPITSRSDEVPLPQFMEKFLRKYPLHAIQGLRKDVEPLETLVRNLGYYPEEIIDYDLMALDREPPDSAKTVLPALIIRKPQPGDEEDLFVLQSAYEQEEVLPRGAIFDPASCRLNLERIIAKEQILVAELDSQVVGKINTSAVSFSRYQIGGVYVHPAYRRRGIGRCMAAAFVQELLPMGRGLSLFVKKHNTAARAVYQGIGFDIIGDYRISYYPG